MLSNPESEFEEFDRDGIWAMVYQKLRHEASVNHKFSIQVARLPEHKVLNRYRDVNPYDHSRVILGRDESDYINASLVECPDAGRSYILAQGPLSITCGHFWLMVWEQNCPAILMLNRVVENNQSKCYQYFPTGTENEGDDFLSFDDVNLRVNFISETNHNFYTVRVLHLEHTKLQEERSIIQFHYTTWPDFGVPQSPAAFLKFLAAVRESGVLSSELGPPVIHCSAGIGRSGTFVLVDTCLVIAEKCGNLNSLDIRQRLMDLRRYRMGLIQTHQQLRFSYLAIIEGFRLLSQNISEPAVSETNKDRLNTGNQLLAHAYASYSSADDSSDSSHDYTTLTEFNRCPTPEFTALTHSSAADHQPSSDSPPPPFEPPPPPPPTRTTSLSEDGRVHSPAHTPLTSLCETSIIAEMSASAASDSAESKSMSEHDENHVSCSSNNVERSEPLEIRRRAREERLRKTAEKVAEMKKKQRECELHIDSNLSTFNAVIFGLSVTAAIGSYLIYRYYY